MSAARAAEAVRRATLGQMRLAGLVGGRALPAWQSTVATRSAFLGSSGEAATDTTSCAGRRQPDGHTPGGTPRDSCRGAAGCRLRSRRSVEVCPWRSRRCPRSGDVRREESDPARSRPSRDIGNSSGVGSWAASARHAFKSAGARTSRGLLTRCGRLGLRGAADRCPATESKRKRASEGTDRRARTRVRSASRDAVPRGRPAGLAAVPRATAQLRTNR